MFSSQFLVSDENKHGIYADSDGLVAQNNIVRHNAGFGIHCYSDVKNAYIANNLVYGHTFRPGVLIACATHIGKNVIVNNTIIDNAIGIRISGAMETRCTTISWWQKRVPSA